MPFKRILKKYKNLKRLNFWATNKINSIKTGEGECVIYKGTAFEGAPTTVGAWENNNLAKNSFQFKNSADTFSSVYFKNPGEKAIPDEVYQNSIGGEDLVRLQLNAGGSGTAILGSYV